MRSSNTCSSFFCFLFFLKGFLSFFLFVVLFLLLFSFGHFWCERRKSITCPPSLKILVRLSPKWNCNISSEVQLISTTSPSRSYAAIKVGVISETQNTHTPETWKMVARKVLKLGSTWTFLDVMCPGSRLYSTTWDRLQSSGLNPNFITTRRRPCTYICQTS